MCALAVVPLDRSAERRGGSVARDHRVQRRFGSRDEVGRLLVIIVFNAGSDRGHNAGSDRETPSLCQTHQVSTIRQARQAHQVSTIRQARQARQVEPQEVALTGY